MNLPKANNLFSNLIDKIFQVSSRNYRWQPGMKSRVRRHPSSRWPNTVKKWPGGQEYYKFTYYPRYPDQEDPEWEPSPLFLITRRKRYEGTPYYEKRILKYFRIEQPTCRSTIVVNDEVTNAELWKIKHLITITPITFPDGLPSEKDIGKCHLYENGQLRIDSKLGLNENQLEATEKFQHKTSNVDKHMIEKYVRGHWIRAYQNVLKDV